jgi:uncharacterized OsmC-like protein
MKITASVDNRADHHELVVSTNGHEQSVTIAPKAGGGSSVNGGELLFAALATCYCNDIYREAKKRGIRVSRVRVDVDGEFGGEGEMARNVTYGVSIDADASREAIDDLLRHTDTVAEIQKSLRNGVPVSLLIDRES